MAFSDPYWLLVFLPLLMFALYRYRSRRVKRVGLLYPKVSGIRDLANFRTKSLYYLIPTLRYLALSLIIFSLARPQIGKGKVIRRSEGLDIVLAVDTSESMRALDFKVGRDRYDRLTVVKKVMREFVKKRTDDRISVVVFGTKAYTQVPLTLDHGAVHKFLEQVEIGVAGKSTAIGDGLGVAIQRLKDLKAKSKIIILLTDGDNTAGQTEPEQAADAAKALGVKVYTIGVGSNDPVPYPTDFGVRNVRFRMDEKRLKDIAQRTGGEYFRAKSTEELLAVYESIDRLEKTKSKTYVFHNHDEKYAILLWPALMLLMLEVFLKLTRVQGGYR